VTSNLGCIGLAVEDADELDRLIAAVLPAAASLGRAGDVEVFRWQDPSGACLIIDVEGEAWVGLSPSFAGTPGAALVALGIDVTVRDSAQAGESFLADADAVAAAPAADTYAQLAGTVLRAERRTVAQTGQQFIAARVRTTGFELDVCLAASDHPTVPTAGQIIAGTVFLVASREQEHRLHKPKKYGWRRD
jgi:hypothetical protein